MEVPFSVNRINSATASVKFALFLLKISLHSKTIGSIATSATLIA